MAMALIFVLPIAIAVVDFSNLQDSVERYNNNVENAPPILRTMLGNESFNMTILLINGSTITWGIQMDENAKIAKIIPGGMDDPTIVEYAAESAINDVLAAEDTMAVFQKAQEAGQIRIEGKTQTASWKLAILLRSGDAIKYYFGIFSSP
jgi:hypothetical protein